MPKGSPSNSLKTRIFISSGLMVLLCVTGSLLGWVGQQVLLKDFAAYERSDQTARDLLRLDRLAERLKFRAESYVQTGATPQFEMAIKLNGDLLDGIADVQDDVVDPELSEILDHMRTHIDVFGQQLLLASNERRVRSEVLQQQLPAQEERVDQAFAELERRLEGFDSGGASEDLFAAVQAYAEARKHMLRYFIDPDTQQSRAMVAAQRQAQRHVDGMHWQTADRDTNDAAAEARAALAEELREYQVLSSRAVQATRGYLFYTNVVMAGEISEFVHYSNQLKQHVRRAQVANRLSRNAAVRNTRTLGLITSLVSVVLAAGLAVYLSYVIFHPISELTDTFWQLSEGRTIDSIPSAARHDEIGQMASAAEVFSLKNRETRELLARSEKLSEELSSKARALEESNHELDQFAYVASHDLKSPLRGLNSLAEWVQEDCGELLPDESKSHLKLMQDRVRKMEMLLNDLLDYSRIGRHHQAPERVDLDAAVKALLEMTDNPTGVQVVFPRPLPVLNTMKVPLQQVILNLITNAIKYNDKGPQGRVEVGCEDGGEFYRFSIADNGIGIDPKYHDRIFQMYQRVAVQAADGTGMGLAIVKKQIERLGGQIEVQATLGGGATFAFTWPKVMVHPDTSAEPDLALSEGDCSEAGSPFNATKSGV